MPATKFNKKFVFSPQPEGQLSPELLNWPAFDYYCSLRKLKEGVGNHSPVELSLQAAARVACLEPKYFSSFFRKKVGISFITWRNCLRVNKAIEIISKSDYSMAHVADAAGFNDLRTFERAFKRYTGMTPRDFKKSILPSPSLIPSQNSRILP
jgi:AraC-like DNA-binding protein